MMARAWTSAWTCTAQVWGGGGQLCSVRSLACFGRLPACSLSRTN